MNRSGLSVCLLTTVMITATGAAQAQELKTMDEVGSALNACWSPPSGSKNSAVTLSFSFKRDGSLMGPPRASAINVQGDDAAKKAFLNGAIEAIEKCTPLKLAPALAEGIGGNVFTMRFHSSDQ
ncbi:hypothetical protein WH297_02115 [Ochrobactrum vermis]|uniref:Cell envelope integrity protein TolA n=1 Tax=Ochrobactrum vermis TaxID=1827297 RepID=A0ABU8P8F3_9HYPH|nr:hypothetical protein [Ochrobactrum vermis]PQZ29107.1 hypothetical protein CQZ93_02145 [Ochrobactrum vermis]